MDEVFANPSPPPPSWVEQGARSFGPSPWRGCAASTVHLPLFLCGGACVCVPCPWPPRRPCPWAFPILGLLYLLWKRSYRSPHPEFSRFLQEGGNTVHSSAHHASHRFFFGTVRKLLLSSTPLGQLYSPIWRGYQGWWQIL